MVVLYNIGGPVNVSVSHDTLIPWYLPGLWYCFGKACVLPWQHSAPAVPGLIVVFHLQQEKDLFSSQRFHVNILQECVCVISGVGSGLWWLYVANNCRNIFNGCFFFRTINYLALFFVCLCLSVCLCVISVFFSWGGIVSKGSQEEADMWAALGCGGHKNIGNTSNLLARRMERRQGNDNFRDAGHTKKEREGEKPTPGCVMSGVWAQMRSDWSPVFKDHRL